MKHDAEYVRVRLRAEAVMLGSQRALARKIGVSATFLNEIIRGTREPSGKPLSYLGLRRQVNYVPI